MAIHKDLGIGLPVVNYRESWYRTTIVQNVIKARFHQEEVEEEKRILYVAMTRAEDILYLLGITDGNKRDEEGGGFFQNRMDQLREESAGDYSYYTMSWKDHLRKTAADAVYQRPGYCRPFKGKKTVSGGCTLVY